ncbi:hypothetical protein [Anaerosporobacter faecicola]|uniref:hypothetical protein n=1 Tax=Anaerosporobacter faecicola TaxID=2718714 RepID=UPI00143A2CE7|nr:hypothetical protein [Anaerosporobacter faecicola]
MKEYILRAIFWAIAIMIGLAIVARIEGDAINLLKLLIYGLTMGVVDFLVSMITRKAKKNK